MVFGMARFPIPFRGPVLVLALLLPACVDGRMPWDEPSASPQASPKPVPTASQPVPEPADTATAHLRPLAKPPARATPGTSQAAVQSSPVPPPPAAIRVVGLNRRQLSDLYGVPVVERDAAPARVLEFRSGECQLAAYLYLDTVRNDFFALQYEVNGSAAATPASQRCLERIRDDAARR